MCVKGKQKSKVLVMAIKDWIEDLRPREKLLKFGAESLTDAELLALFLRIGHKGISAVDLAREILGPKNELERLWNMDVWRLKQIKGIGTAKAVSLVAVIELGRRRLVTPLRGKPIRSAKEAVRYLQPMLVDHINEVFVVLFLNQSNIVKREEKLSWGGISSAAVDVRIIMKMALEVTATSIILCHNHPGGTLTPSHADVEATKKVYHACQLMDILLMDHVIVSSQGYYSFAETGRLQA
jgi:DNA repair protein RadC